MKMTILPIIGLGLLMALPFSAGAVAQEKTCAEITGTYAFPDLPMSRNDILPSVKRQFSAIGLAVKMRGCESISLTCVYQAGAGGKARDNSKAQCTSASILLAAYETRAKVRVRLRSEMEIQNLRRPDATSLAAGTVYVTVR